MILRALGTSESSRSDDGARCDARLAPSGKEFASNLCTLGVNPKPSFPRVPEPLQEKLPGLWMILGALGASESFGSYEGGFHPEPSPNQSSVQQHQTTKTLLKVMVQGFGFRWV